MLYKTMVLHLLEQHPRIHEPLRRKRTLLRTLERYARELRTSHLFWQDRLAQAQPQSHPGSIASAALEIALQELQAHLLSASSSDEPEPLSLEEALAFLSRHTPPA